MFYNIPIPSDIKKMVKRRVLTRLIVCSGVLALFIVFAILFGTRALRGVPPLGQIGIYIVYFLLPFLITGVPIKLLGSSWCGTLVNVEIKEKIVNRILLAQSGFGSHTSLFYMNHIYLSIKSDDKQTIKRLVFKGESAKKEFVDFFHKGDEVIHVYGTKFVQKLPQKPDDHINCVVCGGVQPQDKKHCIFCGHTLRIIKE